MFFRRFYDEQLAQASYLLGCQSTGEALVVDPNRHVEPYLRAARAEGLRITHVTEAHIHADFVSGARELAHRAGARVLLSDAGGDEWRYRYASEDGATLLTDGATFRIGRVEIATMHTPGHTPEHLAFLVARRGWRRSRGLAPCREPEKRGAETRGMAPSLRSG